MLWKNRLSNTALMFLNQSSHSTIDIQIQKLWKEWLSNTDTDVFKPRNSPTQSCIQWSVSQMKLIVKIIIKLGPCERWRLQLLSVADLGAPYLTSCSAFLLSIVSFSLRFLFFSAVSSVDKRVHLFSHLDKYWKIEQNYT